MSGRGRAPDIVAPTVLYGEATRRATAGVSWWWGACALALVLAASVAHRVVTRLEGDRRALESALAALEPLRADAHELRSRLLGVAAAAAERRRRLTESTRPAGTPPADERDSRRGGWADDHR